MKPTRVCRIRRRGANTTAKASKKQRTSSTITAETRLKQGTLKASSLRMAEKRPASNFRRRTSYDDYFDENFHRYQEYEQNGYSMQDAQAIYDSFFGRGNDPLKLFGIW